MNTARWQWAIMGTLGLAVLALFVILWTEVIDPSPSIIFNRVAITTPSVQPGGKAGLRIEAEALDPPECLLGTQQYIRLSDRSEIKIPGTRTATTNGHVIIHYEVTLPEKAALGRAFYWVRESYGCGASRPVQSEPMAFQVVE